MSPSWDDTLPFLAEHVHEATLRFLVFLARTSFLISILCINSTWCSCSCSLSLVWTILWILLVYFNDSICTKMKAFLCCWNLCCLMLDYVQATYARFWHLFEEMRRGRYSTHSAKNGVLNKKEVVFVDYNRKWNEFFERRDLGNQVKNIN